MDCSRDRDLSDRNWHLTRRTVLESGTAAHAAEVMPAEDALVSVTLMINRASYPLRLDPRTTLLDALREHVGLTGSKKGCDHGQCGACTVLIDGRRINSCLTLAVMHDGDKITTIEGLGGHDDTGAATLHPLQGAFVAHDGFQCGYCTSGQICSATGMLAEVKAGMPSHVTDDLTQTHAVLTDAEIRERMSGNICRCAAYPNIVAAINQVAEASI
jgi:xanthine dehydrogenase YagT iron-sulfur-binding subunit